MNTSRRHKVLSLLKKGVRQAEIARMVGISRQRVHQIKEKYLKNYSPSKSPTLPHLRQRRVNYKELISFLKKILKKKPKDFGLKGNRWTYEKISKAVAKNFGYRYSTSSIWNLMDKFGIKKP